MIVFIVKKETIARNHQWQERKDIIFQAIYGISPTGAIRERFCSNFLKIAEDGFDGRINRRNVTDCQYWIIPYYQTASVFQLPEKIIVMLWLFGISRSCLFINWPGFICGHLKSQISGAKLIWNSFYLLITGTTSEPMLFQIRSNRLQGEPVWNSINVKVAREPFG